MDVKEKLVKLLNEVQETGVNEIHAGFGCTRQYITNERVAAHLISNGVTVQESIVNNTESKVVEIDHANELPQTNADRIRSMTDEELADFFYGIRECSVCAYNYEDRCVRCSDGIFKWLKKPAETPKEDS